jgi:hypothetical protein
VKGIYYKGDLTWDEVHAAERARRSAADTITDEREKYIKNFINTVKMYDEWYRQIKEKAAKKGISVDTMLRKDAIWTYEKELLKKKADSAAGK